MMYEAAAGRYGSMPYPHCGRSGLRLSAVSLGLWHNFGGNDDVDRQRWIVRTAFDQGITCFDLANNYGPPPGSAEENFGGNDDFDRQRWIVRTAFDQGITCFDLANNYGPPPGSAEENFGRLLARDLKPYRDEMVVCTKAGYTMWPGPYGDWGSRKYLVASLDQSLKRMGLDYVDIFYHHRPDPETPLEETMAALDHIVRSGRALYAGISNYNGERTAAAAAELRRLGTPFVIHQMRYNMLVRQPETDLLPVLEREGIGGIAFSPLAQGLLTDRYLGGALPADSRAAGSVGFLKPEHITPERLATIEALNQVAQTGGRTLAQLALGWVRRQPAIASVLIGASRPQQVIDAVRAVEMAPLAGDEIAAVEAILASQ